MTSTDSYSARLEQLRRSLDEADSIIIGAGSGLTTAAGIDYGGEDFRREFAPWIERYGFTDLYTSSFFPFETQEEYWAYWAMHIWFSRYRSGATDLYRALNATFSPLNSFVITTNVDAQFELAGFPAQRIFATQGDYCWFQPAAGNPKRLENNHDWVMQALPLIEDCRIPTALLPSMTDGQPAAMNLRVDDTFVEDFHWHEQARRYTDFVAASAQGRLLLLEFGVGYNTPGIIRFPFEQMASRFPRATLVRFNPLNPQADIQGLERFIPFTEDIPTIISQL